jgi:hypothetical protein
MIKTGRRGQVMRKIAVCILALALFGWLSVTTVTAYPPRADFALYDQESVGHTPDVSVQAGATADSAALPLKRTSFVVHITMTNRGDCGGENGFVKVKYQDGDFVDYAIPKDTTIQISLAGGGTPGVDQIITVSGTGGAVLVGQISLITDEGKPHPNLFGQTVTPRNYCSTKPGP